MQNISLKKLYRSYSVIAHSKFVFENNAPITASDNNAAQTLYPNDVLWSSACPVRPFFL